MTDFHTLPSTTDDALLDNLSTADIFRFGRISTSTRRTLQSYMKRRYKLNHVLSRFFTDDQTEELRTLMSDTGMIISGSVALQFLDRIIYPDSDLDFYAPLKYAWHIADWLIAAGYTYAPKTASLPTVNIALLTAVARHGRGYPGNTPSTKRGYLKATCVLDFIVSDPPRKIQLISTLRSTIELILGFHSTCVMNFITHDKAYCLFPRATLEERRALTYLYPSFGSDADKSSYHKYVERGWDLQDSITRNEFDDPYSSFARGTRFVGDRKCWTLPVLPLREDLPQSNAEINSFALEYNENLQPVFSFRHLDLYGLQQPYVLLEEDANYVMVDLDFPHVCELLRNRATSPDVRDHVDESEQTGKNVDEAFEDGDDEGAADIPDNASMMKFDHTLKLLMGEIRELDINNI